MTNTNAPNGEPPAVARAARMRIAVSAAAAELADCAAALVPTDTDSAAYTGELVEHAGRLVSLAAYLRTLTVTCERVAGVTWPTIGEALGGITRQAAHDRYATEVGRYERGLVLSWLLGDEAPAGLPEGVNETAATAARLDRWLDKRGTDPLLGKRRTASAALAPPSLSEEASLLIAACEFLLDPETSEIDSRRLRIAHHRRAVAHWRRVADDDTAGEGIRRGARECLADHAARLAELESETSAT